MNKQASLNEIIMQTTIYIILVVIFFIGAFLFISSQMNGAAVWEDYYSKEISTIINAAQPGDTVKLDVYKATEIAKKNNIPSFSEIFTFDNAKNKVCVKLSLGRKTCYSFFNDVDIKDPEIKLGQFKEDGSPINILNFALTESQRQTTQEIKNE
ncbi:MAG: hypothetical protein Q7S74_01745 [Nanoarchaeota archaeon]|nr:hypothetical protein [Nanoarchaeota archaeon]